MTMKKPTWILAAGGTALVITAPFHQDFEVDHQPDSPPSASIVSSSSAAQVWDAVSDNPIDVRPLYNVKWVWKL